MVKEGAGDLGAEVELLGRSAGSIDMTSCQKRLVVADGTYGAAEEEAEVRLDEEARLDLSLLLFPMVSEKWSERGGGIAGVR